MKIVRLVLLLVIVLGIVGGGYAGYKHFSVKKTEFYYLDIVNTGKTRAEIQVSLCNDTLVVESEMSKVFKVEKQDPAQKDILREFTIKSGGKIQTLKANVAYSDHTVLDVTGDSCIVVADYGLQYRADTLKLPPGTKTIKILKVYQKHEQVFPRGPVRPPERQARVPARPRGRGAPAREAQGQGPVHQDGAHAGGALRDHQGREVPLRVRGKELTPTLLLATRRASRSECPPRGSGGHASPGTWMGTSGAPLHPVPCWFRHSPASAPSSRSTPRSAWHRAVECQR